MSNGLSLDKDRHFVGPDLGTNCLQRLSEDNKSQQARKEFDTFFSCIYRLDTGENQIFNYLVDSKFSVFPSAWALLIMPTTKGNVWPSIMTP